MSKINRLTDLMVRQQRKSGRYSDGNGLYLFVRPTGGKAWTLRYSHKGLAREMMLGLVSIYTLKEARGMAIEWQKARDQGLDPIEERKRQRMLAKADAITFKIAAEQYIESHSSVWRNPKHAQQWRNTMRDYAYPVIGSMPVRDIDPKAVLLVLNPIWTTKTETARRVQQRLNRILDWCTYKEYRYGENPARWKGGLVNALASPKKLQKPKHFASLPYEQLPAAMKRLQELDTMTSKALQFVVLTTARSGEVRNAEWSEVDLKSRTWTIPANRMKNDKSHVVALSNSAVVLLASLEKRTGIIFPSPHKKQALSDQGLNKVMRKIGLEADVATVHGFRSSFRNWAEEKSKANHHVIEMSLSHYPSDGVIKAYLRTDLLELRRDLSAKWGRYCTQAVADVVELRTA